MFFIRPSFLKIPIISYRQILQIFFLIESTFTAYIRNFNFSSNKARIPSQNIMQLVHNGHIPNNTTINNNMADNLPP